VTWQSKRRVLFFGSEDFHLTRPISQTFFDISPEAWLVECDDSLPGMVAYDLAERNGYFVAKVDLDAVSPQPYDRAYGFLWHGDSYRIPQHVTRVLYITRRQA
jgi:hypothetical protein